ncbi:cytosine permease [Streptomyces sp. Je 1-4]|nr:cytosine permease [Streptomyces sp. Je 1-4]UZQ40939.1 cytosine permease [Streptomyces sp. Je 1-4] [Streptomyces sp. Je 1-4 4N24]UZQ48356.1 cytosine permease [Streptomyces sp. Je 1-4] [Streptomyces sp. Je 1-4 4N24_ara]
MVLGTVVGAVPAAYLGTWGSRTGTGQLPLSRLAFGRGVALPGIMQWLSSVAWHALIGLFGGAALAQLLGWPFWLGALVVLLLQGVVGVFGYEALHQLQRVMTFVLGAAFVVPSVQLLSGVPLPVSGSARGGERLGAFVLTSTIALSLAISWAPYASDFSRYLPRTTSRPRMFWYSLLGMVLSFAWVQALGLWGAELFTDQTAAGVHGLLGGDARLRAKARRGAPIGIEAEFGRPQPWWPACVAFVAAFAAAVPFMNTTLFVGPVAAALHGDDFAYYIAFLAYMAAYVPLRLFVRTARTEAAEPVVAAPGGGG